MLVLSSGTLTQAIRNFAKSLENWLTSAMCDFPQETVRTKVTLPMSLAPFDGIFASSVF